MESSLLINCAHGETRVALLEDGVPVEIYVERADDVGLVGNIYKGRVTRVLPGMEAAFVDIGLDRAAFLYVDDIWSPPEVADEVVDGETGGGTDNARSTRPPARELDRPSISQLLKEQQDVLVQVSKDPIGSKGARVTAQITLAGRYTVLLPQHQHVGISKRITAEAERQRLRTVIDSLRKESEGFIVRTEAQGLEATELAEDVSFLRSLWEDIESSSQSQGSPSLVQADLDVVLRATRDLFTRDTRSMIVDSPEAAERIRGFLTKFAPDLVERVRLYEGAVPLFDHYGVETEIEGALLREVSLKSGGSIVIDQAEALTAIDINTGSFVGKQNLESTILRTNLEAAKTVVAQLRLRNIGGIIIIDFIDMESEDNRQAVFKVLCDELARDRSKTHPLPISTLGVVEMTRKRVRESLGERLTEACPYCSGLGRIRSRETVCHEIFRELDRLGRRHHGGELVVGAHPEVAATLAEDKAEVLGALEARLGGPVIVQARRDFHQERYEILRRGEPNEA